MSDDLREFGASFKGFLDQIAAQAPTEEPVFACRFREHFGVDPLTLPIVAEELDVSEHPNIQVALEDYFAAEGRSAELVGIAGDTHAAFRGVSLSELLVPGGTGAIVGPVQYANVNLDGDRVLACVQCGLYLIQDATQPLVVLLRGASDVGYRQKIHIEVMATDRAVAENFLSKLRLAIRKRNVYRGHVISLETDGLQNMQVKFHHLPAIDRDQIILPEGILERVERQAIGFSKHAPKLLAAGQHLKRGVLLHGPPGTGKTLTAMYLAGQLRDRTILLLTGRGLGLIEQSCAMARILQPSVVILEDVDLIAQERSLLTASCTVLLFELLNQMDGLTDDADVLFLLTTNRPEILEPALASRPGRIDQAIEIPPPDARCRRRLFELYGKGLTMRIDDLDHFVSKTEHVSAAFIRELIRKAALFAADESDTLVIEDRHLREALEDLVVNGGSLTKSLLGFRSSAGE